MKRTAWLILTLALGLLVAPLAAAGSPGLTRPSSELYQSGRIDWWVATQMLVTLLALGILAWVVSWFL